MAPLSGEFWRAGMRYLAANAEAKCVHRSAESLTDMAIVSDSAVRLMRGLGIKTLTPQSYFGDVRS